MARKILNLNKTLHNYVLDISLREVSILKELRIETQKLEDRNMQITPMQGQFMAFLVKLINAQKLLEIGTFTGYSTLALAIALPENGHIIACDINKEWTDIGSNYWQKAGVDHKISLHLAPATDTLKNLIEQGQSDSFDFAFIDADKENYNLYYEATLRLLRPGGLLLVDNTLWSGKVMDLTINDPETIAIRNLNTKLKDDKRINLSLLPIYDGLTLIHKKVNII